MLELAAFASLAQFGAGLGLALTFFLEPIAARSRRFRAQLDSQYVLIPNDANDVNNERRSAHWTKIIALESDTKEALAAAKNPIRIISFGCVVNLLVLILATVVPEAELDFIWMWTFLILCILPIAAGSVWLAFLANTR